MKWLAIVSFVALTQQSFSCQGLVQGKAVEQIREYFPEAEAMDVLPCVLSIETHVDNVSRRLIGELAHRLFSGREMRELATWMELSGYNYFILGFTHHTIVFDRYQGRYYVFSSRENTEFFLRAPNFCSPR